MRSFKTNQLIPKPIHPQKRARAPIPFPCLFTVFLLLASWHLSLIQGATLPGALRDADVDRITEVIGLHASSRILRSAEAYHSWPGIKFGFEVMMIPARNVNSLGDGAGTLSSLNPTPRLYLAKGLFIDSEVIINFFPVSEVNPITSLGFIFKHTFYQEVDSWLSSALFLGVTSINACSNQFKSTDIEIGVAISRDYVRLKPFMALGVLVANGTVSADRMTNGVSGSSWFSTLHFSLGTELELPINLTAQIDLMNLSLGGSLLVGKRF